MKRERVDRDEDLSSDAWCMTDWEGGWYLREKGENIEGITTKGPNGMLKKWKKLRGLTFYRVQGCGDIR